ncbi:hypothetical protein PINS_up012773 [Pythium insidiosum]|nr:hypothetical protein PINS_up012773 [Pythium insidiosum]
MSRSSISSHHQEEISKFLKFFRSRLKTHLENIDAEFEDTRSDRLSSDDVYSQKDVQDVLQSLCFAVKATTRCELQDTINMMALLLREIFVEAEDSRLSLELDIAKVEDKELLERVEKLGVAEWVEDPSPIAKGSSSSSSSSKKVNPVDQRQLQLEREKQSLEDEVRAARHTSQQQQEEHERELRKLQRKLADARTRVEQLERQAEDAAQHVSQTPQFQSMKRMVAQKNQQLQELRRRLQRYEPLGDDGDDDGGKDADDDDD